MKKISLVLVIVLFMVSCLTVAHAIDYSFLDYLTLDELLDLQKEVETRIAQKENTAEETTVDPYSPKELFLNYAEVKISVDSLINELKTAGIEYTDGPDELIGVYRVIRIEGNNGEKIEFWYLYSDQQSNLYYYTPEYNLLINRFEKKEQGYYYTDVKSGAEKEAKDLDKLLELAGIKK